MWTAICEDARGLYVEGKLARMRDALELMRGGGWKACPSAFAPSRRARMPALARATSSKPIFGKSRSSPFRCGRRRVSSGKAGTADDPRIRTLAHAEYGAEPNCRECRICHGLCGVRR